MKIIGVNNETSVDNTNKKSLWKYGKEQYKAFTKYHVKKSTFIWTTLVGILLTVLAVLPLILIDVQCFKAFYYNPYIKLLLIVLSWALLLICNGLSNYFTVKLTKNCAIDDEKLQAFDEVAIMFYNIFNIGFMIFTLVIMMFLIFL